MGARPQARTPASNRRHGGERQGGSYHGFAPNFSVTVANAWWIVTLLVVCLLVVTRELALFLLFWGYALSMPVRYLIYRSVRAHSLANSKPGLDEGLPR